MPPKDATEHVFVYHTLLRKAVQEHAMGHTTKEHPSYIDGFRQIERRIGTQNWPTLVLDSKSTVAGAILNVTHDDLAKLDKWEDHYERVAVQTKPYLITAWTYILKASTPSPRVPT